MDQRDVRGELYYSLVRHLKPRRIVEIGSGSSTLLALAAAAQNLTEDPAARTAITCIEPYENAWLANSDATLIAERVESLDLEISRSLGPEDILFIDSSNIVRPFGDVNR